MTPRWRLLILESSDWAQSCADWLEDNGFHASTAFDWAAARRLLRSDYDLILVDELAWKSYPAAALQLIAQGKRVAVLSTEYTQEGYRSYVNAGACGYIKKRLRPDKLILEIQKVFVLARLAPSRGRVLVVDNDERVREAIKNRLELESYEVEVAAAAEEALGKIPQKRPHVVVVDIRLIDDKESLDESGFDLIKEIDERFGHAVKIIGLTGSSPARSAPSRAAEHHLAGFVYKKAGPDDPSLQVDELIQKIQAAHDQLGINQALEIEYEDPLDVRGLVRMMRSYQDLPDADQSKVAEEVEELIRKLFPHVLRVTVHNLSPRRGGSGVALVQPVVDQTPGKFIVVKFGPRDRIDSEAENYRSYVQPFLREPITFLDTGRNPAETLSLGGLRFELAGLTDERPRTFSDFFRDSGTTVEEVSICLERLFLETCSNWYRHPQHWSGEPSDLLKAYESHILGRQSRQAAVLDSVSELLREGKSQKISFTPNRQEIEVHIQEKSFVLPDPIRLLDPARAALILPRPIARCRNHGNLHGLNMLLDRHRRVWLIDFSLTGWNPRLLDFVQLESAIKFELLEDSDFGLLLELERVLLEPAASHMQIAVPDRLSRLDLHKVVTGIATLRRLAHRLVGPDLREYYLGLLLHALRMVAWEGSTPEERHRRPVRQRHALLSAALIAFRLENWREWRGWPDEDRTELSPG